MLRNTPTETASPGRRIAMDRSNPVGIDADPMPKEMSARAGTHLLKRGEQQCQGSGPAPLAIFFAYHVLWPQGFGGRFDAVSAVISVAAAVALFRFKVGVLALRGACAAIGLAVTLTTPLLR